MSDAYSIEEIVKLYKDARDKVEQVQILADLTNSDIETILMILSDAGVYQGNFKICARCGCEFPAVRNRQRLCPECRRQSVVKKEKNQRLARLEERLRKNLKKIQKLGEESLELQKQIEGLKDGKIQ